MSLGTADYRRVELITKSVHKYYLTHLLAFLRKEIMKFISKKELKLRLMILEKRVDSLEEEYLTAQIKQTKKLTPKTKKTVKKATKANK